MTPVTQSPLRVGIVCYPSVGGSGIVASELGYCLQKRGHEVHFLSYDLPHRLVSVASEIQFHHIDVPVYPVFRFPPYTISLANTIYTVADEHQLDLVHVHYAVPHSTSAILAKQMLLENTGRTLKVVTTLHGTDIDLIGWEPSYRHITEYSINSSDAITAVSDYLRQTTLSKFNLKKDIDVVYNPIDTDLYAPADRSTTSNDPLTIVHISNFRPVKRVTDAIKILDMVRPYLPVRLVFLGDGPDLAEAQRAARQLGVSDQVTFAGKVNNVQEWLGRADLLLSTSELESFGLSIAEAMACELPVVAYNVGGIPEVLEDGVHGRLVRKGCFCEAARAILELLSRPEQAVAMGKSGRKKVVQDFSSDVICGRYEHLYYEMLGR